MRDLTTMREELESCKFEHAKILKMFHRDWKKGKIHDEGFLNRSRFLRSRIENLHININQEMQKCWIC